MQSPLSILQDPTIIGRMSAVGGLGKFVRDRREALGKTGRDFAEQLDIEPSMLSRLETGAMKTFPEPELVRRLAELLEVSTIDLLLASGYLRESDLTTDDGPIVREFTGLLRRIEWTDARERMARYILRDYADYVPDP